MHFLRYVSTWDGQELLSSLLCSQEPFTGSYPEPVQSSQTLNLISLRSILMCPPIYVQDSQVFSSTRFLYTFLISPICITEAYRSSTAIRKATKQEDNFVVFADVWNKGVKGYKGFRIAASKYPNHEINFPDGFVVLKSDYTVLRLTRTATLPHI
jgi:hypothetical protein